MGGVRYYIEGVIWSGVFNPSSNICLIFDDNPRLFAC